MSKGIVSAIFVLVLIGSILFLKQASTECMSQANRIPAHSMAAYGNVTTHEGDLIANGTQIFVIENCTYVQRGNIFVRDHAKMKICNSVFRMDQNYWFQFRFYVDEYASLEVVNSRIADPKGFGLSCLGYSKTNMTSSDLKGMETLADNWASVVVNNCTAEYNIVPCGNCSMAVSDSGLGGIELNFPPDRAGSEFRGFIDGLRFGRIKYWRLQQNQTGIDPGCDLTLINTTVNYWCLDIEHKTELVLSDSTLGTLWIWYRQTDAEIYGLHPGYFEDFGICNLTLRKTSIRDIWVYVFDSASVDLIDAKVSLHFWPGKCTASLSNSEVNHFYAWFSSGILFFNQSSLVVDGITNTQLHITGDVKHIEWPGDWFSSNVTRNYTSVIRGTNNSFLEDVELTLFDQDNTALWNGFSDSLGEGSFNLTFTDSNYTGSFELRSFKEGLYNATMNISLLSNTPIVINLTQKPLGDINEDRVVNIIDISLVAYSFGCKPPDSRWNDTCDLNDDGEINILDISMVAKDYGKTV